MQKTKTQIFVAVFSTVLALVCQNLGACTNVLVTKGASADGSNMISYAADSHALFGELYYKMGETFMPGATRDVVEWDTGRFLGTIPQVRHTYTRTGNSNEKQLTIGETTYGGREELWHQDGATMDYGSLIYIALERCSTAREAIDLIYELTNLYGYCSEGESFSIADKDEVWVMDLIGKGNFGKGIVYVARRVPDGFICAHANQSRITTFPLNSPDECKYSPDVIEFARSRGYFDGEPEQFSFADAYAPLDFGAMRGCESRAWSAFNILCDAQFTFIDENGMEITRPAMDYIDYAMGFDKTKRFPLFVKPSRKISVSDVAAVMRDHFEGTPMDMTTDIGAGGNRLPYRWRPMSFTVDGKEYYNERAIATQQTGFWFIAQSRPSLPDLVGGLVWFGCDDAATSYLTPIYTSVLSVPHSLEHGNGDMLTYSPTSAFWMCNRVANACYKAYDIMAPAVTEKIKAWEKACADSVKVWDAEALKLYNSIKEGKRPRKVRTPKGGNPHLSDIYTPVRMYLTGRSTDAAESIFRQWVALEEFLLVKYIDGNVKAQNPDGSWVTNGNGNIPDKISQPGYSDKWKEAVAADHGDVLMVR